MFAEFLLRSYAASKSVSNALSSLRTFHLIHGHHTLGFDTFEFALWKRALPITRRTAPSPAPPLPLPLLRLLCTKARTDGPRGHAFATLLATAFYSLARLSSLVPRAPGSTHLSRVPLLGDVTFQHNQASLLLKWGKSAQHPEQAFKVPLLPTPDPTACPVSLLQGQTLSLRQHGPQAPLFAFRVGNTLLSFTLGSARQYLAQLLRDLGMGDRGYTFHSLRRGGCTLAFTAGASRSDLQLLGGWRSDAIDSYLPHFQARQRAAHLLARAPEASTSHLLN